MAIEERVQRLEDAFFTLTQLARSMDERVGQQPTWINQLGKRQERIEANLSTLTEIVGNLGRAQKRTEGDCDKPD